MIGVLGVVAALALLMYLAYRGISVLILAPLTAVLAVVLSGELPLLATYTQIFMPAAGQFVITYFPLFLLGAVFGKLMDASGSARALADWVVGVLGPQRAILAVMLSCALLTYGGVSLFVVAFAVFPIAAALFRNADIPKRLIPATIALGAFTFTMTALPGTPAIQNAIPMPFFGTTPFAAPGLGVVAALVMAGFGLAWLHWRAGRAASAGEGYGAGGTEPNPPAKDMRDHAHEEAFDVMEIDTAPQLAPPNVALAAMPVVLVVALNLLFVAAIIPAMDTTYLAEPLFGATTAEAVRGIWAIIAALTLTILVVLAVHWRRLTNVRRTLDDGANASVLPIFNTASLVGFGAVVAALPAFELIRDAVMGLGAGNPLVSLAVAVGVLAGITGSASGGMIIALQNLGPAYVEMAQAAGISLELMHRVTAVATGGLDTLPHNGAVITLLAIAGLTHRESYGDLFMVAVLGPVVSLVVLIALGTMLGSF